MKYVIVYIGAAVGKRTGRFGLCATDESDVWSVARNEDRVVDATEKEFKSEQDRRYTPRAAQEKRCVSTARS